MCHNKVDATWERMLASLKNYEVGVTSDGITFIQDFIKISQVIQILKKEDADCITVEKGKKASSREVILSYLSESSLAVLVFIQLATFVYILHIVTCTPWSRRYLVTCRP
jgi:hypothetical protein